MANPFLVLGGIAVGIITASFGVLQVPGWVASAQDASAINDLSMVANAQAASASLKGKYAGDLSALQSGELGLSFTVPDDRVKHFSADGDGWCSVVLSDSGRYFAASDTGVSTVGASTVEAAIADTCGPVVAQPEPKPEPTPEPKPEPTPEPTPAPTPEPAPVPNLVPATQTAGTIGLDVYPREMSFSADGRLAFATTGNTWFNIIDLAGRTVTKIDTPSAQYLGVEVSPGGKYVGLSSVTGGVAVYDAKTFARVASLATGYATDLSWSPDGKTLAVAETANTDYTVSFYDVAGWSKKSTMKVLTSTNAKLTPLQDGRFVVHSSNDNSTLVVDPKTGASSVIHTKSSRAAAAPDGSVWLGYYDTLTRIDPKTKSVLETVKVPRGYHNMALSTNGRWLYSQNTTEITIYDTEKRAVTNRIPLASNTASAFALSPDGRTLLATATGATSNQVNVFTSPEK